MAASRELRVRITGDTADLERALQRTGGGFRGLSMSARSGSTTMRAFGAVADQQRRNLDHLTTAAKRTAIGVAGIAAAGLTLGIKLNAQFESATASIATFLGSTKKATAFVEELRSVSSKSPLRLTEWLEGSRKLLGYGVAAKKVVPLMSAMNKAIIATGGSAEEMDRVSTALGQIAARGKASSEELNQLSDAGVPVNKILQKELGLTGEQIANIGKEGVNAERVLAAIGKGWNREYSRAYRDAQGTFDFQLSHLKKSFEQALRLATEPIFKVLRDDALPRLNKEMGKFVDVLNDPKLSSEQKFTKIKKQFEGLADELGDWAKRVDLGGKIEDALGEAIPVIAKAAGKIGSTLAKALVKAFLNADALGKLLIGAWVFKVMGGFGVMRVVGARVGERIAAALGRKFLTTVAPYFVLTEGGGGAFGSKLPKTGKIRTLFRALGMAGGIAFGVAAIYEIGQTDFGKAIGSKLRDTGNVLGIDILGSAGKKLGELALGSTNALGGHSGRDSGGGRGAPGTRGPVGKKAHGGKVTTPLVMVGEEAPRHPEYVLSTNPRDRRRNLPLWAEAGHDLGVPGFARGGIKGPFQALGQGTGRLIADGMRRVIDKAVASMSVGAGVTSTKGLVPQVVRALAWARGHGWHGGVTSGFRSIAEQSRLYYGAPANGLIRGKTVAAPGRSSHNIGQAVDVTDIAGFAHAMASAPPGARLYSRVPGDPVHFSVTGHRKGGKIGSGRGSGLSGAQRRIARTIIRVGKKMGKSNRQIIAALSAGIVESELRNVKYAAKQFYKRVGRSGAIGELAADVQRPLEKYRGRYGAIAGDAADIFRELQSGPPGGRKRRGRPIRRRRGAVPPSYEEKLSLSDIAITRAEGTGTEDAPFVADDIAAQQGRRGIQSNRLARVTAEIHRLNKRLRTERLTAKQRKHILERRAQLMSDKASLTGDIAGIDSTIADLQKPAEIEDATAKLAEEMKALREEIAQQNRISSSEMALGLKEATRALADIISGQLGGRAGSRRFTAGAGSVTRA